MTLKLSIMNEEKRPSINDYQATPEQLAAIAVHDRKRAELVALTLRQWDEKKQAKKNQSKSKK